MSATSGLSDGMSPSSFPSARRGSVDSVEVDLNTRAGAPAKSRLRFLQSTEGSPSAPRKPTPRPSPAALAKIESEEKKTEESGPNASLSNKNRLEVRSLRVRAGRVLPSSTSSEGWRAPWFYSQIIIPFILDGAY